MRQKGPLQKAGPTEPGSSKTWQQAAAVQRALLRLLANEVNYHRSVFAILPPDPRFGDVGCVVEMKGELVLMAGGGRREVCRTFKLKDEFFGITRRRNGTHPRLIVGRTVVNQCD